MWEQQFVATLLLQATLVSFISQKRPCSLFRIAKIFNKLASDFWKLPRTGGLGAGVLYSKNDFMGGQGGGVKKSGF